MVLVINSGSSSIKFSLYNTNDKKNIYPIASGLAERIRVDGRLTIKFNDQKFEYESIFNDHGDAIALILNKIKELKIVEDLNDIKGIGFRIVHGGRISESCIVDRNTYDEIKEAASLAPLHNPPALMAIDHFKKLLPTALQVVCFDTAFHQTMPEVNYIYPLNYEWYKKYHIRKYGFHGTSYKYITNKFIEILNKEEPNLIVCHLGNGASICSIKNGKSFDTTMGLSPLGGLMMGTRCGDIDPSIVNYLCKSLNKEADEVNSLLNNECGLKGVSLKSSDLRDVITGYEQGSAQCILALDIYTQKIADFIVKMVNQQGTKIDAIAFTAGIGENSNVVREMVVKKCHLLQIEIDQNENNAKYDDYLKINSLNSKIDIYKIRTDEELMICLDVLSNLKK